MPAAVTIKVTGVQFDDLCAAVQVARAELARMAAEEKIAELEELGADERAAGREKWRAHMSDAMRYMDLLNGPLG